MPCSPEMRKKADTMLDSMITRFDSIIKSRSDAFEEAHHPRNAGGVFTTGEGKEPEEEKADDDEDDKQDTQDEPGMLGKKNAS